VFDEFELVIVRTVNQQTSAKRIGYYNTTETSINISLDYINEALITIPIETIPLRTPVYEKSEAINRNGAYALRVAPTGKFDFNYQPLANQINTEWVMVEQAPDYYRRGGNQTGYMRDEQYAFWIRWIYNTGDKSSSYHIPGRAEEYSREIDPATGLEYTGYGLYGSASAPNYLQGNTLIGTTANTGTYKLDVRGLTRFSAATGTSLTVISSGNSTSAPVFSVQGSQGELFSVTDSLTGSLFSVSDISGLPIMEVFSDSTIVLGDYQAPSLYTTKRVSSITATTGTTIYSFPTSAYTSSFVDYYVSSSTGLRAGNIMAIWSGSTVNFTETSTNDIGNTTPITFGYVMSGSSAVLRASASTGTWIVESILRGL
jgi:hypothetical protein